MPDSANQTTSMNALRGLMEAREALRALAAMYKRNVILGRNGKAMSAATASECRQALIIAENMIVRRMQESDRG